MGNLGTRIERTQTRIGQLQSEHGSNLESEAELRRLQQLKKNLQTDFGNAKKEVAALEKQAKNIEKEKAKVDQLRASFPAKENERNTMEERLNSRKPLDDLKEQEAELQKEIEQDKAIIEDPDASPSDVEAARRKSR